MCRLRLKSGVSSKAGAARFTLPSVSINRVMLHITILDEDGIYDPGQFNDRLLLGLKGAMSEAELHILKGRLQGGIKNKARRGELEVPLPIGLVYHPNGSVALDPDQQVRGALQLLFDTFRLAASATATVKRFHQEGWL